MQIKRYFMVLSILALLAGGLFVGAARQPVTAQAQNLLANPGFDLPYTNGVANGWSAWHEDSGEKCSTKPADWDFVCQPGWGEEMDYNNLGLTQGAPSQHVGAQYITWHAGVYQTVSVPPGSGALHRDGVFPRPTRPPAPSYTDWAPRMQVGIDPEGRGQWYTGVIWSAENNIRDSWQALSIEATAGASGKVTVFVSSQFRLVVPLAHMDSWWDNARLEVVTPPATPTSTPAPTRAAPPTPQYTPTPRPDGAVVHVVQEGDTLFGIALQYNVSLDELRRLNAGTLGPNDLLQIGQEIIISGAPLTLPTPTPTPETAAHGGAHRRRSHTDAGDCCGGLCVALARSLRRRHPATGDFGPAPQCRLHPGQHCRPGFLHHRWHQRLLLPESCGRQLRVAADPASRLSTRRPGRVGHLSAGQISALNRMHPRCRNS